MSSTIILYDIPGNAVKTQAWSPNTWKARFALNMKGLPYKTIGAEHTGVLDGKPHYTLPVIHDTTTGAVISESYKIAQYLDKTYPSAPRIIPAGTDALQRMFTEVLSSKVGKLVFLICGYPSMVQLPPRSLEYFSRTREAIFGKPVKELLADSERGKVWKTVIDSFGEVGKWMDANGKGKVFVMGDVPSFADGAIASQIVWMKTVLGMESVEWKDLMMADEGRWAKFAEEMNKWEFVDEEGLKSVV
ncbi:hypothetical protein EW146_g2740 [Bondarzewia mesenterica]|uniref:GST N-terminal domain-containing protein n=1 Tax=Bondarzewia mesenterica TaxID=1095465 RepID=A0A4S4LZQ8_9AGAM|nr:hypothetical protein EW146_g2740 [Bondarzewia mesenterica]